MEVDSPVAEADLHEIPGRPYRSGAEARVDRESADPGRAAPQSP